METGLWTEYWTPEHWSVSAKGNDTLITAGHGTITLFRDRHGDGWSWCVARSSREGPHFAPAGRIPHRG